MRSLHGSLFGIKGQNKWLWGAGILSLILTSVVVLIEPVANIFDMTKIGWEEYLLAMGLGLLIIPLVEIGKIFSRIIDKKKHRT